MTSKYQKKKELKGKPRGKRKGGKGTKPKVVLELGAPVYQYTSKCCDAPANKPATVRDPNVPFKDRAATLGTWVCSRCRKKAKVSRSLNKEGLKVDDLLKTGTRAN